MNERSTIDLTEARDIALSRTPVKEVIDRKLGQINLIHTPQAGDLHRQDGINAYEWVSFHPERRADQDIAGYVEDVFDFAKHCAAVALTPEQREAAVAEVERYRQHYVMLQVGLWASSSRCASPVITGPARFPVERNRKRMAAYEKRSRAFLDWREKARKAAVRNIGKVGQPEPARDERPSETETLAGVQIVRNFALDRVQLVFDGKPDDETRGRLKSAGWRWSPREGAWQRKLTNNALYSARYCISGGTTEEASNV